jgi:hypothetical protein
VGEGWGGDVALHGKQWVGAGTACTAESDGGGGGRRLATSRAPARLTFCSTTTTVEPTSAAHEGEAHHVICASTGRSWAEARPRTSARPTRRRRRSILAGVRSVGAGQNRAQAPQRGACIQQETGRRRKGGRTERENYFWSKYTLDITATVATPGPTAPRALRRAARARRRSSAARRPPWPGGARRRHAPRGAVHAGNRCVASGNIHS